MSKLRFVHTADLHLDSPFIGLKAIAPDNIVGALREATFEAYDNIIELCIAEQVDALLIAGDVYDGADRSLRAQLKFVEGLRRLDAAEIRSFVCHGNHDPLNGWEARLDLPDGCVRFNSEVTGEPIFSDEPERAVVYGVSYPQREVRENLSPLFHNLHRSNFNIGLLHANVGGNTDHDSYAPCSVSDLEETSIDYWALGHVHTRSVLREKEPSIVYPGNPQGRHPNELGARGAYLVEVDESGNVELEFRPVDVIRWERRELDIADLEDEQDVLNAVYNLADSALDEVEGRPVVLRLALSGRGAMNRWLRQTDTIEDVLEQLNDEYAGGSPWLWCERIQLETASPIDREQVMRREDFVGDLARVVEGIMENPDALDEMQLSLRELYDTPRARRYLRELLPAGDEMRQILSAAEEECLAGLLDEEDGA